MNWFDTLMPYVGRIIGVAGGLFFGFLFLLVGFWKTLFFAMLVFLGYYLGRKKDRKEELRDVLTRIFPDKFTHF